MTKNNEPEESEIQYVNLSSHIKDILKFLLAVLILIIIGIIMYPQMKNAILGN